MSRISIEELSKYYPNFVAVDNFNLSVAQGEFIVFLGPSGCGKTTTLRMIAGFIEPTAGKIRVGDRDLTNIPTYDRNVGIVFQNYALFPHLTVFENVAFGLRRRKIAETEIVSSVQSALSMVQLDHLTSRMPRELSGGQQQRVALARAIVISPDVLLLDEPLSNLDAKLRLSIRKDIRTLQQKLGITTILVTHDQEEAMSLADRIVIIDQGKIQQIGSPQEIYSKPTNRFVADFIGAANFIEGKVIGPGRFKSDTGLTFDTGPLPDGCEAVVVRPEAILVSASALKVASNCWAANRENLTYLGSGFAFDLRVGVQRITAHVSAGRSPEELSALQTNADLHVHLPPHAIQPI